MSEQAELAQFIADSLADQGAISSDMGGWVDDKNLSRVVIDGMFDLNALAEKLLTEWVGKMSERAELIELFDTFWDSSGMIPVEDCADTILAAGYRKPRTITTRAELDSLREGAVIRDGQNEVHERYHSGWHTMASEVGWCAITLPAVVLWRPEA